MELTVVELDRAFIRWRSGAISGRSVSTFSGPSPVDSSGQGDVPLLQDKLVVEAKLALGCPTQVRPHHNLPVHIGAQHGTCRVSTASRESKRTREQTQNLPSLLMSRLTVSMTSTNASFFLYLTSDLLHDVAPVAWIVILDESSRCFQRKRASSRRPASSPGDPPRPSPT